MHELVSRGSHLDGEVVEAVAAGEVVGAELFGTDQGIAEEDMVGAPAQIGHEMAEAIETHADDSWRMHLLQTSGPAKFDEEPALAEGSHQQPVEGPGTAGVRLDGELLFSDRVMK
jgi:hypothetical protein